MLKKLAAAGAIIIAGAVLTPSAAQAKPAHCDGWWSQGWYNTTCWGGTGWYNAYVDCWRDGQQRIKKGSPVVTGAYKGQTASFTRCDADWGGGNAFAELHG